MSILDGIIRESFPEKVALNKLENQQGSSSGYLEEAIKGLKQENEVWGTFRMALMTQNQKGREWPESRSKR